MSGLDFSSEDENLLVSLQDSDDALVYKFNENQALIKSLDFFTPVLDDPYLFGQAAAANSFSDIYAMGGRPTLALNICCFPDSLDKKILQEILRGGVDKAREAGAIIGGGHTVEDDEPKYGLSVTGTANPEEIITNGRAEAGDKLVLTKALGTGIMATALKADFVEAKADTPFVSSMLRLNSSILSVKDDFTIKACTDVTGFGLAGHLLEMLEASQLGCQIIAEKISYFERVPEMMNSGLIPGGLYKNQDNFSDKVSFTGEENEYREIMQDLIFDPQTSGGLLLAVPAEEAEELAAELKQLGEKAAVIGEFTGGEVGLKVLS